MIEMRVGHEDEIDVRQMMDFEPRLLQTLDHFQPLRPDRVDQQIDLVRLNEKRRVPDPGDADFALADFGKLRLRASDGIRTSVRKLRLCQSAFGRSLMRVERLFSAPSSVAWRTIFLRLFFEKGIGTAAQAYKLVEVNQRLSRA